MRVRDVMTRRPLTAKPEETVNEVARRMFRHKVSGLPVVDEHEVVVGVISEGDLLRRCELGTDRQRRTWLEMVFTKADRAAEFLRERGEYVRDVMARDPVTINVDASLAEVAETLERRNIKRMPVLFEGRLVGIISRADLIRALAVHYVPKTTEPSSDRDVVDAFYRGLTTAGIADNLQINALVEEGALHLWGLVETDIERRAVETLARQINGVKQVRNHLGLRPSFIGE